MHRLMARIKMWRVFVVSLVSIASIAALDISRVEGDWAPDAELSWQIMVAEDRTLSAMAPDQIAVLKPLVMADFSRSSLSIHAGGVSMRTPSSLKGFQDPVRFQAAMSVSARPSANGDWTSLDDHAAVLNAHDGLSVKRHQCVLDADDVLRVTSCLSDGQVRVIVYRRVTSKGGGK